jgi:hypothetical protein
MPAKAICAGKPPAGEVQIVDSRDLAPPTPPRTSTFAKVANNSKEVRSRNRWIAVGGTILACTDRAPWCRSRWCGIRIVFAEPSANEPPASSGQIAILARIVRAKPNGRQRFNLIRTYNHAQCRRLLAEVQLHDRTIARGFPRSTRVRARGLVAHRVGRSSWPRNPGEWKKGPRPRRRTTGPKFHARRVSMPLAWDDIVELGAPG